MESASPRGPDPRPGRLARQRQGLSALRPAPRQPPGRGGPRLRWPARACTPTPQPVTFTASWDDYQRMNLNFLEFEQPIAELEAKIEELRFVGDESAISITDEIERLQAKSRALTENIFSNLNAWQVAQLARHPQRPYCLDYVQRIFTDFEELHGDRAFADDAAIVSG